MTNRRYLAIATLLGAAGVAFAGYLSFTRLRSGVCAFEEPCPLFLGAPACFTGLALFAAAFLSSLSALLLKVESSWPAVANVVIGAAGTAFAGRMALIELAGPAHYKLGLPTCAYGFIFFLGLLVLSLAVWVKAATHFGAPHPSA
jgi:hypothetical protein